MSNDAKAFSDFEKAENDNIEIVNRVIIENEKRTCDIILNSKKEKVDKRDTFIGYIVAIISLILMWYVTRK